MAAPHSDHAVPIYNTPATPQHLDTTAAADMDVTPTAHTSPSSISDVNDKSSSTAIATTTATLPATHSTDDIEVRSDIIEEVVHTEYKVYWQRWLMLGTFCALSCSNGMAWLTYATVATYAMAYYNVDALAINMMAVIYEIIYVALALFAGRMTQKLGLRNG